MPIKRILLVRPDRLGDLLMNLPVIHRLKQNHPHATLTLVCAQSWAPLFHHHLDVNRVIGLPAGSGEDARFNARLFRDLRAARFDCAVITAPSKEWHWRTFRLGIPVRLGFDRKWGCLLTRRIPDRKAASGRHEIDSNLEVVDSVCAKPWNGRMELGLDMHPRAQELIAPLGLVTGKKHIFFHLTSTNPSKEVPPSVYAGVFSKLLEKARYRIVVVGAQTGPYEKMLKVFEGEPQFVNLIGRTRIEELALLLKEADTLVTTDSGPFHLAWVQGVPTLALFVEGAEGSTPARWGVYPGFAPSKVIRAAQQGFEPSELVAAIREQAGELVQ